MHVCSRCTYLTALTACLGMQCYLTALTTCPDCMSRRVLTNKHGHPLDRGELAGEMAHALQAANPEAVRISNIVATPSPTRARASAVHVFGSITGTQEDLNGRSSTDSVIWIENESSKPAGESNLSRSEYQWVKYLAVVQERKGCTWHEAESWKRCKVCCSILASTLQQGCLYEDMDRVHKVETFAAQGVCVCMRASAHAKMCVYAYKRAFEEKCTHKRVALVRGNGTPSKAKQARREKHWTHGTHVLAYATTTMSHERLHAEHVRLYAIRMTVKHTHRLMLNCLRLLAKFIGASPRQLPPLLFSFSPLPLPLPLPLSDLGVKGIRTCN